MPLSVLNRHRSVWMGIAMLWIVFFHSGIAFTNPVLASIQQFGYGGVDLFMFASGLGAYYSYTKTHDPVAFLARRLARLAPVYLPFIAVWFIYRYLIWGSYTLPFRAITGNIFALEALIDMDFTFNWYVSFLLIIYILAPLFCGIVERIDSLRAFLLFIAVLLLISVSFSLNRMLIIVSRLPVFAAGMYYAKLSKDPQKKLTGRCALLLAAMILVGFALLVWFYQQYGLYLSSYGLHWYPFLLIAPGMCILISAFAEAVCRFAVARGVLCILRTVGGYTFEIYLLHILLLDMYEHWLTARGILEACDRSILLVLLMIIPLCALLRACSVGCLSIAAAIRKHIWPDSK